MRVAITGTDGQLGRELVHRYPSQAIALDRSRMDLTNREAIFRTLRELRPTVVINCAAYTAVDKAEDNPEVCYAVNAEAVRHLAEACSEVNAKLVQISTDYVFGGASSVPWRETDPPCALGVYAQSKVAGEVNAATIPNHLIIRSGGLYAPHPKHGNFVETMLRLGSAGKSLRIVNDQFCTPTYVQHLAAGMQALLEIDATGIYHVVNTGTTNWHDFALHIFELAGLKVDVTPITTEQYGARAPRPKYSVLDTSKFTAATQHSMPSWQEGLRDFMIARNAS